MNETNKPLASVVPCPLTPQEQAIYEWQMWTKGFGIEGQRRLRGATVMISRVGGVGGIAAMELAAAGIGRLVLAHGGVVEPSDLSRQLLMTHDRVGHPRIESIVERLTDFNPRLEIIALGENVNEDNAAFLVEQADLVIDASPEFDERYAMNDAAFKLGKPIIECSINDFDARITTMIPGQTQSLRDILPEPPKDWKRQVPLFGASTSVVGGLAAVEAIKIIAGLGEPLIGRVLEIDLRTVTCTGIDRTANT
jgi:molybdopterin-synthase adenylyltransferase